MWLRLLDRLACPKCHGELICDHYRQGDPDRNVLTGELACGSCSKIYPIVRSIPRFVDGDAYTASFGYQWNRFRLEQLDSRNGLSLSARRFFSETGWSRAWLGGKWILDAGCGAGRFLDVASENGCEAVGVDLSSAVDATAKTLEGRANVHLVQASLFELPFRKDAFDGCYCIGVIQHTPDPQRALKSLPRVLNPGGRLAVTIYERKPWTKCNVKYLLRPFTKSLPPKALLAIIQVSMPILFAASELTFRIPYLGQLFSFIIPVANYVHQKDLTLKERYRWAILDTFDMFSPAFDQPQTESEVETALSQAGITEISRLPNPGVNMVGTRSQDKGGG